MAACSPSANRLEEIKALFNFEPVCERLYATGAYLLILRKRKNLYTKNLAYPSHETSNLKRKCFKLMSHKKRRPDQLRDRYRAYKRITKPINKIINEILHKREGTSNVLNEFLLDEELFDDTFNLNGLTLDEIIYTVCCLQCSSTKIEMLIEGANWIFYIFTRKASRTSS